MGKLIFNAQAEPLAPVGSSKHTMYVDSADGKLKIKDNIGNVCCFDVSNIIFNCGLSNCPDFVFTENCVLTCGNVCANKFVVNEGVTVYISGTANPTIYTNCFCNKGTIQLLPNEITVCCGKSILGIGNFYSPEGGVAHYDCGGSKVYGRYSCYYSGEGGKAGCPGGRSNSSTTVSLGATCAGGGGTAAFSAGGDASPCIGGDGADGTGCCIPGGSGGYGLCQGGRGGNSCYDFGGDGGDSYYGNGGNGGDAPICTGHFGGNGGNSFFGNGGNAGCSSCSRGNSYRRCGCTCICWYDNGGCGGHSIAGCGGDGGAILNGSPLYCRCTDSSQNICYMVWEGGCGGCGMIGGKGGTITYNNVYCISCTYQRYCTGPGGNGNNIKNNLIIISDKFYNNCVKACGGDGGDGGNMCFNCGITLEQASGDKVIPGVGGLGGNGGNVYLYSNNIENEGDINICGGCGGLQGTVYGNNGTCVYSSGNRRSNGCDGCYCKITSYNIINDLSV